MSGELDQRTDTLLQTMTDMENLSKTPESHLSLYGTAKIPLANLSALGVAFQPLAAAIQTAVSEGGGSGLYYVNTKGMQMFSTSEGYIGSLRAASGAVGGGQACMTQLPCDPTMLFMAAALMNIEKKLDVIQETQKEILTFLEEKERAALQGNLNTLNDITGNFKYHWNNETYKTNKHILVQEIRKEAEASIIFSRSQIEQKLKKRSLFHSDQEVKSILKKVQAQFKDYQLALYLYAYSALLEVMLLGNFDEQYLTNVEQRISNYSYHYRALYTDCYNLMEAYSNSSIQTGMIGGLAAASRTMGDAISKIPVINKSQLDEGLVKASSKLEQQKEKSASVMLAELAQVRASVTLPFVESIQTVNTLYNQPVQYLCDGEALYVQPIAASAEECTLSDVAAAQDKTQAKSLKA